MKTEHTASEKQALRANLDLQVKCAERYEAWQRCHVTPPNRLDRIHLLMNLHYADADCGMNFEKLLAAPDADFLHDMHGIERYMNKSTCKLENCFLPRCSA